MSLQNLLKIGQLAKHERDAKQVRRMLESAKRGIADARQESISPETRLDAAYRAITQLSMVALWASGFRTSKSRPGHHQILIQSPVHTIDLGRDDMLLLDTFRVKRNAIDYLGDPVDESSVDECIEAAARLVHLVSQWLADSRPELTE